MYRFSSVAGAFIALVAFIAPTLPANAIPIKYSFAASDFGVGAPQDPVVGTIVYEAASLSATIDSLIAIDLTIAGHAYTLGEIGLLSQFGTDFVIGGSLRGGAVVNGTDDFFIRFDTETGTPEAFVYATAQSFVHQAATLIASRMVAVPEPSTLALFGFGLLSLAGYRRWQFH